MSGFYEACQKSGHSFIEPVKKHKKKHKTNCIQCWKEIEVSFDKEVEEVLCIEVICKECKEEEL